MEPLSVPSGMGPTTIGSRYLHDLAEKLSGLLYGQIVDCAYGKHFRLHLPTKLPALPVEQRCYTAIRRSRRYGSTERMAACFDDVGRIHALRLSPLARARRCCVILARFVRTRLIALVPGPQHRGLSSIDSSSSSDTH
jgi:hypothetical protein